MNQILAKFALCTAPFLFTVVLAGCSLSIGGRHHEAPAGPEKGRALTTRGTSSDEVAGLGQLAFLVGHWRGQFGDSTWDATYGAASGGRMLGHSELRRQGEVSFFEFEIFRSDADGLTLQPHPEGKASVLFRAVTSERTPRRVVFANLQHDWPTQISYENPSPNRLRIIASAPNRPDAPRQVYELLRVQ